MCPSSTTIHEIQLGGHFGLSPSSSIRVKCTRSIWKDQIVPRRYKCRKNVINFGHHDRIYGEHSFLYLRRPGNIKEAMFRNFMQSTWSSSGFDVANTSCIEWPCDTSYYDDRTAEEELIISTSTSCSFINQLAKSKNNCASAKNNCASAYNLMFQIYILNIRAASVCNPVWKVVGTHLRSPDRYNLVPQTFPKGIATARRSVGRWGTKVQ